MILTPSFTALLLALTTSGVSAAYIPIPRDNILEPRVVPVAVAIAKTAAMRGAQQVGRTGTSNAMRYAQRRVVTNQNTMAQNLRPQNVQSQSTSGKARWTNTQVGIAFGASQLAGGTVAGFGNIGTLALDQKLNGRDLDLELERRNPAAVRLATTAARTATQAMGRTTFRTVSKNTGNFGGAPPMGQTIGTSQIGNAARMGRQGRVTRTPQELFRANNPPPSSKSTGNGVRGTVWLTGAFVGGKSLGGAGEAYGGKHTEQAVNKATEEDTGKRDIEEELSERDIDDEELWERDFDEELWERDVNDFEDLSSRDPEQELYARNPFVRNGGRLTAQAIRLAQTTSRKTTQTIGQKVATNPPTGTTGSKVVGTMKGAAGAGAAGVSIFGGGYFEGRIQGLNPEAQERLTEAYKKNPNKVISALTPDPFGLRQRRGLEDADTLALRALLEEMEVDVLD